MPSPEPSSSAGPFALVGWFDTPGELVHACEQLREAGYRRFDAHTPFPVHGLDRAMGLRPSKLPWIVLAMGLLGGVGAFALQMWTMGIDYPQNLSGKPVFAWQAYVPVTFEATILFAAFGAFFGMWLLNGLPRLFHPVMQHHRFDGSSDDRFLVSVEASDPAFDPEATRALLERLGAKGLEEVAP
jgi:hypothetical protein